MTLNLSDKERSYRDLALLVTEETAQRQQTRIARMVGNRTSPFHDQRFQFSMQSTVRLALLGSSTRSAVSRKAPMPPACCSTWWDDRHRKKRR
jgi:hypothetical protein